jgi:Tfp pilus assembly protein PilO
MTFTSRERIIMFFAVVAVVLLVADKYLLSPLIANYSQTQQTKEQLKAQLEQSEALIKRKALLQKQWQQIKADGLTDTFAVAESNILRHIKDSALKNNLTLSSVQPERIDSENDIRELEFIVSGMGSMNSVTNFLWDIETSKMPLKVKTFQLGSNDENAYQMAVQIKLSSIYIASKNEQVDEK